jgi:hypothetical protein
MANFPSNRSTDTYYYSSQLRKYILQFMAIFAGLKVSVGKNDYEQQDNLIYVPVRYGSNDRVVAAILAGNNTNQPVRVPTMAAYLRGIQMSPELRKGVGVVERRTFLERGRAFPSDLKVIEREMPIPYTAVFELSILASNSDQHYQMLEQILTLFNPILQIQTSDDMHDWKRITTVELTDIGLEENYPSASDSRLIQTTLTFAVPIHLAPPTVINRNFVADIRLRIAAVAEGADVVDVVADVTREFPPYESLVSAKDL